MIITRVWAMPSSDTFTIAPIRALFYKYHKDGMAVVDPFARNCKLGTITNDMDASCPTTYHKDALDFLRGLDDSVADMILLDPPYSYRQVKECYNGIGIEHFDPRQTRSDYWSDINDECARVIKAGGVCIKCGWNSEGLGGKHGMDMIEVLLVPHGGHRNDTLVTVERKRDTLF